MGQIIDINRTHIPCTTVFRFSNNSHPFIFVDDNCNGLFVDLSNGQCYGWEENILDDYNLHFYTKENDDDFQGVLVLGEITY